MAEATGDAADLPARLDALRASGAAERDPVHFAYLEALSRRAATQPDPIRQPLLVKLSALADALPARPATAPQADTPAPSLLADLLAYISQHAHEPLDATQTTTGKPIPQGAFLPGTVNRNFQRNSKNSSASHARQAPELKSVAYFHKTWSKLSTEQQLTQTLAQAPENAGPMNSQHLVLRSLQVMRDIAPDYLQGFMSYIDTLIWLEQADPTKPTAGRSSPGEREKKPKTAKRSATNR